MSDTTPRDPDDVGSHEPPVDAQDSAASQDSSGSQDSAGSQDAADIDTGDVAVPSAGEPPVVAPPAGSDTSAGSDTASAGPDTADADAELPEHDTQPRPGEHPVTDAYGGTQSEGSWAPEPIGQDDSPAFVAAPVSAGTHASADSGQPIVPAAGTPEAQRPVYVAAPTPPKRKSNRGLGSLLSLLGAVIFAVVYAGITAVIVALGAGERFVEQYLEFLVRPVFWIPIIFFAIGMIVIVLILNRSRWWAYIIGGFFVGAIVYLSFIGAALLDVQAWQYTPGEVQEFLRPVWVNAFALISGILAREVAIWMGAWLAARGRRLTARNAEAQADYERRLAEGPHFAPAP